MSLPNNTTALTALLSAVNALPDKVDTSGTAVAADIYAGKTATVNDVRLTGSNPYNAANVEPAVANALAELTEKGVDTAGAGLADIAGLIAMITGGALVKVGSIVSGYTQNTLDIKSAYPKYAEITVDDIYLVPATFTITQDGTITGGTYNLNKSYDPATGTLTAWRDSVPGQVGLNFNADVYVCGEAAEAGGGYASGEITAAADTSDYVITHGLGHTPKAVVIFYKSGTAPQTTYHMYAQMGLSETPIQLLLGKNQYNGGFVGNSYTYAITAAKSRYTPIYGANNETVTVACSYVDYKLMAGVTYVWIVI